MSSSLPPSATLVLVWPESMQQPWRQVVEEAIVEQGLELVGCQLPTGCSDKELDQLFAKVVHEIAGPAAVAHSTALAVGGFSLGARIAARNADTVAASALLCFGYPFHRHGNPQDCHGLNALRSVRLPTLVVQGSRDAHGSREFLAGCALPSHVDLHWVEDGNHSFHPRDKSGLDQAELFSSATQTAIDFLCLHLLSGNACLEKTI